MLKLNDTQLVILSAAAQRDDGLVLPLPASLDLDETGEARILKSLMKCKLISARPASRKEPEWQAGSEGARQTLAISGTGLKAINVTEGEEGGTSPTAAPEGQAKKRRTKDAAQAEAAKKAANGNRRGPTTGVTGSTKKGSIRAKAGRPAGDRSQANMPGEQSAAKRRAGSTRS